MEITTAMIKELRQVTGAGVLDCRKALAATGGDIEAAVASLREKGLAEVAKKSSRQATEGRIEAYVHPGNRIAVMLELNCETDFVADTEEFGALAHDLALHIAFASPVYVTREGMPDEVIEDKKGEYRAEALEEGKPERILDRIVEGRLEKFYQQACLVEQSFVKDEDRSIQDLINDAVVKFGENVVVRRFARYKVGEGSE